MPTKTCVFASCHSDSRADKTLKFARFVKESVDKRRAEEWVSLVARDNFSLKSITQYTFVCEKHFQLNTVDFDYRTNKDLTPFREGTALPHYLKKNQQKKTKKFHVLDEHDYYSNDFVNKVTKSLQSYEKRDKPKTSTIPIFMGVPVASQEINFQGIFNFLKIEFKYDHGNIFTDKKNSSFQIRTYLLPFHSILRICLRLKVKKNGKI